MNLRDEGIDVGPQLQSPLLLPACGITGHGAQEHMRPSSLHGGHKANIEKWMSGLWSTHHQEHATSDVTPF